MHALKITGRREWIYKRSIDLIYGDDGWREKEDGWV